MSDEVGCEQDAEDAVEFGFGAAVFADEESVEDELVHLPFQLGGGFDVGRVAVGEEAEAAREVGLDRLSKVSCDALRRCFAPVSSVAIRSCSSRSRSSGMALA